MLRRHHLPRFLGAAILLVLFSAASVHAQTTTGTSSGMADKSAGGKLSKADAGMMRDMAYVNVSEVAAGKIATNKSKNEHIVAYAKQMIDDHSAAMKELTQLAQDKGVTLPTEPDKKHQAAAKKLEALSGDQFDRAYLKENGLQDHQTARKLLMSVRDKATDPDVKSAAEKMLPTVEQHLKMAQDLQKQASKSTSSGTSGTSGASGDAASGKQPK